MTNVTWIEDGKTLKVDDDLTAADVLEFAEALIEEHGWVQRDSGDATKGWSIHGAIGEAANRLNPEGVGGKDSDPARKLRDAATALLLEKHPGQTDLTLNDQAASQAEIIDLLKTAREGAASGGSTNG